MSIREQKLQNALDDALHLLAHYAKLLNMYDGGQRKIVSREDWIKRITKIRNK